MGCDIHSGPSRVELDHRERIKEMQALLRKTPLTAFTADYAPDICLVMQGRTFTPYDYPVSQALERLEKFFADRDK